MGDGGKKGGGIDVSQHGGVLRHSKLKGNGRWAMGDGGGKGGGMNASRHGGVVKRSRLKVEGRWRQGSK
jgi:hypothetical protein